MKKESRLPKNVIFLFFLILAVSLYQSLAWADVVYLKDGRKIEGEIERQDEQRVYLKIKMGVIGVNRDEIEKIEKTPNHAGFGASPSNHAGFGASPSNHAGFGASPSNQAGFGASQPNQVGFGAGKKTKEEKFEEQQKDKGLVKYKGRWVSPEEKARLEFPKIKISNRRIYKDGKFFFIKGIAYSVNYPKMKNFQDVPLSTWENDFQMIKKAGANSIRTYSPLPPELLDLAEKYELMVIETIVYPDSRTNYDSLEQRQQLINEALRIVKRDKVRQCILMWSIWNDAPFHWESGGNVVSRYGFEKVNKFLEEIYRAVKKEDEEHPVTASNILDVPGSNLGFDFLDAIGINAFVGLGEGAEWYEGVYEESRARETLDKMVEISEQYNKPVYIAETGYSTFCPREKQDEIIREQIINSGDKLSGLVIFEWADEWWKAGNPLVQDNHIEEHWGITDAYRNPKPGYQAVSEMFQSIPTDSRGYSR